MTRPKHKTESHAKRSRPGNRSYGGYEYQILVTVWVALDLIVAKQVTDAVTAEPASLEDIEANLNVDSDRASASVSLGTPQYTLFVQAKSRSTGPWRATEIADIVAPHNITAPGRRGPAPRKSPLEMLSSDLLARYILVTDESVQASLKPLHVEALLEWPEGAVLPTSIGKGLDPFVQDSIAQRIALCSITSPEVLRSRIARLLTTHGHVPSANQDACLKDLQDEVRRRLLGSASGLWARDDVRRVLTKHGGSSLATRGMDHYVEPKSFTRIWQSIKEKNIVVIDGPSGTGKTLTADILEYRLCHSEEGFIVVGAKDGPATVRDFITRPDPVLFHLRDPWGENRLAPEADRWANELPKLLSAASPNRKFVITSRTDILTMAGHNVRRQLAPYIVSIEEDDYDDAARACIYDNKSLDLSGPLLNAARAYRDRVLAVLKRPYEIDRFMAVLTTEDPDKLRPVDQLIADSQIDAISQVVEQQTVGWGADGVQAAAVVWGLVSARGGIAEPMLPRIRRRMTRLDSSFHTEVEAFVEFLVAGRNLRRSGGVIEFHHPRIEDGLRMAIESNPAKAEQALSLLVDALVNLDEGRGNWGAEVSLGVRKAVSKVKQLKLSIDPHSARVLDSYLEAITLEDEKRWDFETGLRDLARFGSAAHVPSQLARLLIKGGPHRNSFLGPDSSWSTPTLGGSKLERIRKHPSTRPIVNRFARDLLPFTHIDYDDGIENFLYLLSDDVHGAFFDAVKTVAGIGAPTTNLAVIVQGALRRKLPPYDEIISFFLEAEAEADKWFKQFQAEYRQAEEHEVDAVYADHVIEEPSDRYYVATEGLRAVVEIRRSLDGYAWLTVHHEKSSLVSAWAHALENTRETVSVEELVAMLDLAPPHNRASAWSAVAKHWKDELRPRLEAELVRKDLVAEQTRQALLKAFAVATRDESHFLTALSQLALGCPVERQLELVVDLNTTTLDRDLRTVSKHQESRLLRAQNFAANLTGSIGQVATAVLDIVEGASLDVAVKPLSKEAIEHVERVLPIASPTLAGVLACLGSMVGLDPIHAAERLLALDDAQAGRAAVLALSISGTSSCIAGIYKALGHGRREVRREAMRRLLKNLPSGQRNFILEKANDRSADIRLSFAEAMQQYTWPEAIPALLHLLTDSRDFNNNPGYLAGPSWPEHRVGRAAATALGCYDPLPEEATTQMHALISGAKLKDPFVRCAILGALSQQADSRIDAVLVKSLAAPGFQHAPQYRPIAQAAAWGLVDRAMSGRPIVGDGDRLTIATAATDSDAAIAAPAIVAIGIWGLSDLTRQLWRTLTMIGSRPRAELLLTALVAGGHEIKDLIEGYEPGYAEVQRLQELADTNERDLERIAKEGSADPVLVNWSNHFRPDHDVEGTTAWLASLAFGLPIQQPDFDPRAFRLPQRIGVLNLRSLTPGREERSGLDDGR